MLEPIKIIPHSTDAELIYVRPDGSLCIGLVVTDDSGSEELEEL